MKKIGTLYENWRLAFDIRSNADKFPGNLVNIVRVGVNSDQHSQLPAVFMKDGATLLEFRMISNGNKNNGYVEKIQSKSIPVGDWTHVEISQFDFKDKFFFVVRINGVEIHRSANSNPGVYSNTMLYQNDHVLQTSSTDIRNIVHETYGT